MEGGFHTFSVAELTMYNVKVVRISPMSVTGAAWASGTPWTIF